MKKRIFLGLAVMFFGLVLSACSGTKMFKVTFVFDNSYDIVVDVEKGKKISKDQYPVLIDRGEQIFVGWEYRFYDEDGEQQTKIWKETDVVEDDIYLYENWRYRKNFTYKFHYNYDEFIDFTLIRKEGFLLEKPDDPEIQGYEFAGWYTDEDLNIKWDFAQDRIYANMDLYAKWNDLYGNLSARIQNEYLKWNKTEKALDIFVNGTKKVSSVTSGKILLSDFDKDLVEGETYLIELKNENQLYDYVFYNKTMKGANFNLKEPSGLKVDGGTLTWSWTGDANALKYFEVYFGAQLVATQLTPSFDLKNQLEDIDSNFKTKITVIARTTRPYLYSSLPSTINFENKIKEYNVKFIYGGREEVLKTVNGKIDYFTPVVSGQVFNGWYTSFDNGISLISEWDSNKIVSENITLYADFVEKIVESGKTVLSAPKISVKAGGIYWNLDSQNEYFEYVLYAYNTKGIYEEATSGILFDWYGEKDFIYYIQLQVEAGLSDKLKLEIRSKGNGVNTVNSAWVTRYVSMEIEDKEAKLNEDVGIFYWQKFAENYKIEISQSGKIVFETEQKENELKVPQTLGNGNYTIKVINIDASSNGEYILSTGNILTLATPSNINITLHDNKIYIQLSEFNEEFSYFYNIYYGKNKTYSSKIWNYCAVIGVPKNTTTMHLEILVKDDDANYFMSNSSYFLLENLNSEEDFKITGSGLISSENMYEFIYEYNSDLQGIEIKSYIGDKYRIVAIPSHIEGIPVVKIGSNSFKSNNDVFVVLLPYTIKEIANSAFFDLDLEYINLPEGLEKIDNYAFYMNYALYDLVLPQSLLYIGDLAFDGVHFKNLVLPPNIQHIGTNAFRGEIEFVIIPSSVEYLGKMPFGYNSKILLMPSSLDTSGWNEAWLDIRYDTVWNNYVGNYSTEKYQYFVYDENKVFLYNTKIESDENQIVNLKADFNEQGLELVYIGQFVFAGIKIKEVILPDTLKYVGKYAFQSCGAEIVVPASVEYAGEYAFFNNIITALGDTSNWK